VPDFHNKNTYNYRLPKELIAQFPPQNRENCRLLHLERQSGQVTHHRFPAIEDLLLPGDVLVLNTSKVIPARLFGKKESGGSVEVLLLRELNNNSWECLVKPGSKIKKDTRIIFSDELQGTVSEHLEEGVRIVEFLYQGNFWKLLEKVGNMPLPPYIKREATVSDLSSYQTVYASERGSAAAPTAGLHFTSELLQELKKKGVITAEVVLHIGLDTFRPVKVDNILKHKMHCEFCRIPKETARTINQAKQEKRRIIAVGTTTVRTLESFAENVNQASDNTEPSFIREGSQETDIFIYPGFEFKVIDGLLTNFHLPESTLLMMVSAFAGYEKIMSAYQQAVEKQYRFFSYGDAMLIL
jgi:S-adenosylmethionine:tRNA ribosyltransferase-isomerase